MSTARAPRNWLNRERIVAGALELADAEGISGLTMRSLAAKLGAKPMSLYNHFANKDLILDELVELVFAEIGPPNVSGPWRRELHDRCQRARRTLLEHRWAVTLLDSRKRPGLATLVHQNAMIGTLRNGGFDWAQVSAAIALLDSFVYGFVVQEIALPVNQPEDFAPLAEDLLAQLPSGEYTYLVQFAQQRVLGEGYDFADEFDIGLDLVLSAIEAQLH